MPYDGEKQLLHQDLLMENSAPMTDNTFELTSLFINKIQDEVFEGEVAQELLQFLRKPMLRKHFSLLEIKTLKRHACLYYTA